MRLRFNKINSLFILLVLGMIVLTGCSTESEGPMEKARAFLNEYYTVDESQLAEFFYEGMVENPKPDMDYLEEFGKMVEEKYGPWMTEEGYQNALANRFIPGVEMISERTYRRIAAQTVSLSADQAYQDGRMYYTYGVDVQIQLEDGETEVIPVTGEIVMEKVQEEWKVDVFRPKPEGLQEIMTYGVSNLRITNWDVENKIGYVEVYWEGGSGGAINADETAMGLGSTFSFRMPSEKNLLFNVKLFDTEDRALVEYGFETNFSSGRNFQLYIMWDQTRENVILSGSYDSAIIGGADGPTEIIIGAEEGEFQESVRSSLKKVVNGEVERAIELTDNSSIDAITQVVMDHMLRSAAWDGIDVENINEYYILTDVLAETSDLRESYIYIDQGEIYFQRGPNGMRTNITKESYEKIQSFFEY